MPISFLAFVKTYWDDGPGKKGLDEDGGDFFGRDLLAAR